MRENGVTEHNKSCHGKADVLSYCGEQRLPAAFRRASDIRAAVLPSTVVPAIQDRLDVLPPGRIIFILLRYNFFTIHTRSRFHKIIIAHK